MGKHLSSSCLSLIFLLPASDETCLYSTLSFVVSQAKKYGYPPILTFDQPLYWKSIKIVKDANAGSDLSSLVLKLGGFHTIMSFVACIGHLMDGSGLREILEQIYAKDTVPYLLSGKYLALLEAIFLLKRLCMPFF